MAKVVLILGESKAGKTTSIRTLPPKHTFIVNPVNKDLPFEGSEKNYPRYNKETGEGNLYSSKKTSAIANVLKDISDNRPEIKVIILDDNQYLSLFTFVSRVSEQNYQKFTDIAVNMVELVEFLKSLRKDITVFIMQHIEIGDSVSGNPQIQAKTMGKFVKEKVTYEGLFTNVLLADKEADEHGEVKYFLWTRKADSTVGTAMGMFKDQKIDNDLYKVAKRMEAFYKGIPE